MTPKMNGAQNAGGKTRGQTGQSSAAWRIYPVVQFN
jgi:hypothetical protein